jgi:hypothetical protein
MDYDIFDLHKINRQVGNVRALRQSMQDFGWLDAYPMFTVRNGGEKLLIKDGHHRFTVAMDLGIPAKYVICDDDGASIHNLQKATRVWNLADYLHSYARGKDPNYEYVQNYCRRTGFSVAHAAALLSGQAAASSGNVRDKFKAGKFVVRETEYADRVAWVVMSVEKAGFAHARNSRFIAAISRVMFVPSFDHQRFINKVKVHLATMGNRPTISEYCQMIDDVYNRQARDKVNLAWQADQIAAKRQKLTNGERPS